MKRSVRHAVALVLCCAAPAALSRSVPAQQASVATFHNPVLQHGPDPWVTSHDGWYYVMVTTGHNLTIRRTRDITDLEHAEMRVVWTPPATGPYSKEVWAPELHFLEGRWYIYVTMDAGTNEGHRIWVLENGSANPLEGAWTVKGKVGDAGDHWAIDASVFEDAGKLYMIWSGWPGNHDAEQRIYIARLTNPWTMGSERVELSRPQYPWEEVGDLPDRPTLPHVNVNEGPEMLKHGSDLFLVYSASACWTDYYALGMLRAHSGANLLDAKSWAKSDQYVFRGDNAAHVYGTGHNAFFRSPDGTEDWILYHANPQPHQGCGNERSPRAQRFTWNADGTPNFGRPVATDVELAKPSGTPSAAATR